MYKRIIFGKLKIFRKLDSSRQSMTDEERAKLANSLDDSLNNFINNLEKTPYKDGWKEETWREVFLFPALYLIFLRYLTKCTLKKYVQTFYPRKWKSIRSS